ncbi:hypothetical protein KEM52_004663 [Ascosphaera acerosa]|nr:hypothetical protein KEM52_004663 [Ascosphaera acerosa]
MAPSSSPPQTPPAPIYPGRALSFLTLGASLHNVLARLKSLPQSYPSIDLVYSPTEPVSQPVIVTLPDNGVRLRFDGADQRLRLIEVLEHGFSRMSVTYKGTEVVKGSAVSHPSPPRHSHGRSSRVGRTQAIGPSFKHVYHRLFGPSYPGEYLPPLPAASESAPGYQPSSTSAAYGTYILSYPGVAFSFPLLHSAWSQSRDFVSLLSSSAALPATSMSIFVGTSWAEARTHLFTRQPPLPRNACCLIPNPHSTSSPSLSGPQDHVSQAAAHARLKEREQLLADEIEHIMVHGGGNLTLVRRSGVTSSIILSQTTPQDLIAELGPPDAIYRRPDRRIAIHQNTRGGLAGFGRMRSGSTFTVNTSASGTSNGSLNTTSGLSSEAGLMESEDEDSFNFEEDRTDDDDRDVGEPPDCNEIAEECFFNYFHHGFDVFISPKTSRSAMTTVSSMSSSCSPWVASSSPSEASTTSAPPAVPAPLSSGLTATKVLLHGNVPGSFPFNRHRRCRWMLTFPSPSEPLDSETPYSMIAARLRDFFRSTRTDAEVEANSQRGMVLNRGWGESPGSSVDIFGDWEDGDGERTMTGDAEPESGDPKDTPSSCRQAKAAAAIGVLGNTQLFGFPGLLFEVLDTGTVCCLTVY